MFIPQKIFIFLKTPKNIEIQKFDPQKMDRAYVCMKISEYPPPGVRLGIKRLLVRDSLPLCLLKGQDILHLLP